jgi:hypothetical protein
MRKLFVVLAILALGLAVIGCQQKPPATAPAAAVPGAPAVPGTPAVPGAAGQGGTINTPNGTVNVSAGVTEAQIGVPFYPGAIMENDGGGTITSNSTKPGEGGSITAISMTTKDPIQNVVAFYTGKIGKPTMDMDTSDGHTAMWTVETGDKKGGTIVTISSEKSKPGIVTIAILKTSSN